MRIRHILLLLNGYLGVALLGAVVIHLIEERSELIEAERVLAYDEARAHLLGAVEGLTSEAGTVYLRLLEGRGPVARPDPIVLRREEVDRRLARTTRQILAESERFVDPTATLADLERVRVELVAMRLDADRALRVAGGRAAPDAARASFVAAERIGASLRAVRVALLAEVQPSDALVVAESQLRSYLAMLSEAVAENEVLVGGRLLAPWSQPPDEGTVMRNASRADMVWTLVESFSLPHLSAQTVEALRALRATYRDQFLPLERAATEALGARRPRAIDPGRWFRAGEAVRSLIDRTQQRSAAAGQQRLRALILEIHRHRGTWTIILLIGLVAVVLTHVVIRRRIIRPIEALEAAMLRLADDDLSVSLPRGRRRDEFAAMNDALRVFKANAIRRDRLQEEHKLLHERLADTYRQLRRDLDAAAAIQTQLLPAPGVVGSYRHAGLFLPSSVIAGDSFQAVETKDGHLAFFQIDVAGHGAPAALGSVVAHQSLTEALLTGHVDGHAVLVSEIDGSWPEALPYFTLVVGDVSPTGDGRLIQAGHPAPLVLCRDGLVAAVGEGGVPVGLVPGVTRESVGFRLGAGDRLLVYSDGVTEAAAPDGTLFGAERLVELVRAHASTETSSLLAEIRERLFAWRGGADLADDVSILVIERIEGDAR